MFNRDVQLRIKDLYHAIDKAIEEFTIQWKNDDLELDTEKYFRALDSAISDIEVDSGLWKYRRKLEEIFELECQARLKKMRGEI